MHRTRSLILVALLLSTGVPGIAHAQWKDARLVAGQVAFNFAVSFFGKLLHDRQPAGRALRSALVEGATSGLVAHTGYSVAGAHPRLALVGKTLAQKSSLMTRRSIEGKPVFDRSLYSHWQITHSFIYLRIDEGVRIELDGLNAAVAAYFAASHDYHFDMTRTLYTGSMFFRREQGPTGIRGFTAPGVIWIDGASYHDESVLGHELVHTLQNERGSSITDWHYRGLRVNWLALAPGLPALLRGWPEHDRRLHEREANLYAGRD